MIAKTELRKINKYPINNSPENNKQHLTSTRTGTNVFCRRLLKHLEYYVSQASNQRFKISNSNEKHSFKYRTFIL